MNHYHNKMYPFIIKLIGIFKTRKAAFNELKKSRKKFTKIIEDPVYAYDSDVIEYKVFSEIKIHVDNLIKANNEFLY